MEKPGIVLKKFRIKKKITGKEMSEVLECTQQHISALEKNKKKISEAILEKLKTFMNIEEYNELFDSVKFYESSEIIQNKIIELEKENINLKSILQKKRKEKVELKFSDYLKSVIKERNKKLVKIHQETGISTSYLTDILKGRNLPSKEKLELLIKNLNLDSKESQRLKLYWIDSKNPFEEIVFRDDEFDKEKILNEIINFFSNENISIKEKEKTFYLIQNSFFKGKYSNKKNNNF
ncbi:hypothetical protein HMPREF0402_04126 [Fusobacterium ulcerans 12-1B]|uniref:HTH cro/C1-type domain-containing protein n=3 Tax=Fusobacterium TaxID=848 RepID=S2KY15_9FUSO|nr:hypothetical protein HMPREF0402_04126 [Fusobacterium ulcerans 12-1B]